MMIKLANTTYYPAILLRKRWLEAGAGRGGAFDIASELERLHTEPALGSLQVSELERWSTGIEAAQAVRTDPVPVPEARPVAAVAPRLASSRYTRWPVVASARETTSTRRRSPFSCRGGPSPARKVAV